MEERAVENDIYSPREDGSLVRYGVLGAVDQQYTMGKAGGGAERSGQNHCRAVPNRAIRECAGGGRTQGAEEGGGK